MVKYSRWQRITTFSKGDNHDLWIDPGDSLRMVQANDGGGNVSYDGGETWSVQSNQPTARTSKKPKLKLSA